MGALLPLVTRNQIAGGPELYGILLGAIGIGAVGGAFTLPSMRAALGPEMPYELPSSFFSRSVGGR